MTELRTQAGGCGGAEAQTNREPRNLASGCTSSASSRMNGCAAGDVPGRFEEQLKFLEFEFGISGTGGRPHEEICSIGKNVSSAATDSFRSI